MSNPPPLVAVLKDANLEFVHECEIPLERFPDMIEYGTTRRHEQDLLVQQPRQFFRIGITDRKAFYREGTSHRIAQ